MAVFFYPLAAHLLFLLSRDRKSSVKQHMGTLAD